MSQRLASSSSAKPWKRPANTVHFDLLICGKCARRENRSACPAPASSAAAALSKADALAPSTPTLPPRKRAKSMSSAEWNTLIRSASAARASEGNGGSKGSPEPSRPPASTTLRAYTVSDPLAPTSSTRTKAPSRSMLVASISLSMAIGTVSRTHSR